MKDECVGVFLTAGGSSYNVDRSRRVLVGAFDTFVDSSVVDGVESLESVFVGPKLQIHTVFVEQFF